VRSAGASAGPLFTHALCAGNTPSQPPPQPPPVVSTLLHSSFSSTSSFCSSNPLQPPPPVIATLLHSSSSSFGSSSETAPLEPPLCRKTDASCTPNPPPSADRFFQAIHTHINVNAAMWHNAAAEPTAVAAVAPTFTAAIVAAAFEATAAAAVATAVPSAEPTADFAVEVPNVHGSSERKEERKRKREQIKELKQMLAELGTKMEAMKRMSAPAAGVHVTAAVAAIDIPTGAPAGVNAAAAPDVPAAASPGVPAAAADFVIKVPNLHGSIDQKEELPRCRTKIELELMAEMEQMTEQMVKLEQMELQRTKRQGLTLVQFSAQRKRFLLDRGCIYGFFKGCVAGVTGY